MVSFRSNRPKLGGIIYEWMMVHMLVANFLGDQVSG